MTLIYCSSLIHTYPSAATSPPSPVTALAQSPAIDVVGVGYLDGTVRLMDIRQGELIMQVKMDDGPITALSFRMGRLKRNAKADVWLSDDA